jgi:arsenate reductase-like glutaredoxin family protein
MKLRMYVNKGCSHCEAAQQFFSLRRIEPEIIQIGFDRVLQEGMRALSSDGKGLPLPVIISFETQEIVIGADPVHLERIAAAYSASASNPSA